MLFGCKSGRWPPLRSALWILACLGCFVVRSRAAEDDDSPWYQVLCSYKWEAIDEDNNVTYTIRLCGSSPEASCGSDVAVCARDVKTEQDQSVGNLSLQRLSGKVLDYNSTRKCPTSNNNIQTSISFQCGKTMGTPEFVAVSQCVHYFEWKTYAACNKDVFNPHKEVPCYVFDSDGKKHDLNPLIKVNDGYLVDDDDDSIDFYINICRSLGHLDKSCPEGSAACLIRGDVSYNMGSPTKQLELVAKDRLRLQYELMDDSSPPEFCKGNKPKVTITFTCPSKRVQSSTPKMIAKSDCQYEVDWVTEYACHRDYLESDTCKLTSDQHHISIDLTPLTLSSSELPYSAHSGSSGSADSYIYYLNVCGKITNEACGNDLYASSCQVKASQTTSKVAGRYQNQTLRYSDGDLTLIYPDGNRCSSGFQRMTIINFECNNNQSIGHGNPVFAGETDCTYYFNWETPFACVKEKEELLCRVKDGKKRYDLSTLTRQESDGNWEVVNTVSSKSDSRYYLNMCHKVVSTRDTSGCPTDAAICAVDKNNKKVSLGKFQSSPQKTKVGNDIRIVYTDGSSCGDKSIQTIVTLKCKPGDLDSPPVLRKVMSDGCVYELEWYTAAACVLSKTQGENCKVEDPQAGFSFDLSPLTKSDGSSYNLSSGNYNYSINVCGPVKVEGCPEKAGACQVEKSVWSLGEANSHLSYYNGLIKLTYTNGSQYNNKQHTQRSTVISFLCDREAGLGNPEFLSEDKYTYNFRWYTSYACPQRPHECLVTDPNTLDQYDLSSLSRSHSNWQVMDLTNRGKPRKYYINICRPINPVLNCSRDASVCQVEYQTSQSTPVEVMSVSNMGVSKRGPIIEGVGRLLLEFTDGLACTSDGQNLSYRTHIHLVCSRGTTSTGLKFLKEQNCTATFMWETRAACAIRTIKNNNCALVDPDSGFEFNLQLLASESGYKTSGNGKEFLVNICADAPKCGQGMAACELENDQPSSLVGVERTLQYSTNGNLQLVYKGQQGDQKVTENTFTINFVCDPNSHPGSLKLLQEEMGTSSHVVHDVLFEFSTALACMPAPVDCRITDSRGNEYDLSRLIRNGGDSPWIPIDTDPAKSFYINICKPLPPMKECPVGPLGACGVFSGKSYNLGYIQSSPQVAEDGSVSIVYQNGDSCGASSRYSTRIIFQCDKNPGSPMFDREDRCEYIFIWRTSEACPIRKSFGTDCRVRDPKSGYEFNLSSLKGSDYSVTSGKYTYHLAVCGAVQKDICTRKDKGAETIAACQVDGKNQKIAGLVNQNLTYVGDQIILNYTNGDTCHRIYKRSTEIYFTCHPDMNPGVPTFINETDDCTYQFSWPTALACLPVHTTSCSYNDGQGHSYDLSSLALDSRDWDVDLPPSYSNKRIFINVCRSLVKQGESKKCSSSAASCLKDGDKYVSLGQVASGLTWDMGVLKLEYTSGEPCPLEKRNKTTVIHFKCSKGSVVSHPTLTSETGECEYILVWFTAAACPLSSTQHDDCKVTNPATGHLFDLNSLTKEGGYTVYDHSEHKRMFRMNICGNLTNAGCSSDPAVCIKDTTTAVDGGQVSRKLTYKDHVLELMYDGGSSCPGNPDQKHSTVIHFICRPPSMGSAPPEPVLIDSDSETCTHYFSFHTPLACEEQYQVTCSVRNGSTLIDLTPLIHINGYYTATDDDIVDADDTPDFYINICQPLNPIPGVTCPPGAAVCMDPDKGPPVDIGRTTSGPEFNSLTNKVSITYRSSTECATNSSQNYTSTIIFTCQRGLDLGSPQMIKLLDCVYYFEWATPIVCSDSTNTSGCQLTDSQLQFTFNLSPLSGEVKVKGSTGSYHINVCGSVADPACKQSPVCLVSDSGSDKSALLFGNSKAMTMDFSHEEQAVIMQYGGGDQCPPVASNGKVCVFPFVMMKKTYTECTTEWHTDGKKWCATTANYDRDQQWGFCSQDDNSNSVKWQSSILFICDQTAGRGQPALLSETERCSAIFEWRTNVVCPPRKMECKLVSQHKTFDLRFLSSITSPWKFHHSGDSYYINLCQGIHGGLLDCPDGATVCRHSAAGKTETLGRLYTQKMSYNDGKVLVSYSAGDDVCGNGVKASTVIQLSCGATVGRPTLISVDKASCQFLVGWETRLACAAKQHEVEMVNGMIQVPETGVSLSLGALYFSHYQASGDIRPNGDRYIYHIQLSGITNNSLPGCLAANICQVKLNGPNKRRVGDSSKAKYSIKGGNLDIEVSSESTCGRVKTKTVSSTIMFYCNPSVGIGIPEFMMETDECQYLFSWYTNVVCALTTVDSKIYGDSTDDEALSQRGRKVGMVLTFLLVGLIICLLGLLLHKRERRELVMQKVTGCCRRGNQVSYKYSRVNMDEEGGEEEMEWLMEELETPLSSSSSHRGRSNHSNGHITTKPVNTDGLRSFSLDEQEEDSEDEVLSVPGVQVIKSSGASQHSTVHHSAFLQEESDEDLVGLLDDSERKRKNGRPRSSGRSRGSNMTANRKRDEDDSDEDLLRV